MGRPRGYPARPCPDCAGTPATMDVEWFAFVLLPIGVTLLGALLTGVGLKLIDRADRPARASKPRPTRQAVAASGARPRVLRCHHPVRQPAAAVRAPEAQPDRRHVAAAGGHQGSQVGLGLVSARLAPDQHAHVARSADRGVGRLSGCAWSVTAAIDWWIATPRQAMTGGRLSRWWVAVDVAAALVGVAALDLLVEAF